MREPGDRWIIVDGEVEEGVPIRPHDCMKDACSGPVGCGACCMCLGGCTVDGPEQ